jgi:hypothetical protein
VGDLKRATEKLIQVWLLKRWLSYRILISAVKILTKEKDSPLPVLRNYFYHIGFRHAIKRLMAVLLKK